jgi:hypothetical protein
MFSHEMRELPLFGPGRVRLPRPSFKPAVEGLEARVALSASPVAVHTPPAPQALVSGVPVQQNLTALTLADKSNAAVKPRHARPAGRASRHRHARHPRHAVPARPAPVTPTRPVDPGKTTPTLPAAQADLAGDWRDNGGNLLRITRQGDTYTVTYLSVNDFVRGLGFSVGDVAVRDLRPAAGQPNTFTGEGLFRHSDPTAPPYWLSETLTLAGKSVVANPATYPNWTRIGAVGTALPAPAAQADLAGVWRDNGGDEYRITSDGNASTFTYTKVNSYLAGFGFAAGQVADRNVVPVAGQPGTFSGEGLFRFSDPSTPPEWRQETITLSGNSFTITPATYPNWTRIG